MSEREKLAEAGVESQITAEEFASATPDVPADRIRCTECSDEYIGDRENGTICPTCEVEMGIDQ